MNISSGEPPPPGFEDEITRDAEIEKVIQNYKGNALIGLEYTVEIQETRGEPGYFCALCDRRGDPRTIMQHWTSFDHRLKYLEKHYPTALRELDPIRNKAHKMKVSVQTLTEAIEKHHGRLPLHVASGEEFRRLKNKVCDEIRKKKHLDERSGPNFVNAIDRSVLQAVSKQVKEAEGFDEISSDSDGGPNSARKAKKREQSPAYRIVPNTKNTSPPTGGAIEEPVQARNVNFPTPKELSLQASHIAQEKYKWEKYRCLLELYLKSVEGLQKDYEKNPEKHPLYPEEWKAFWNRRYKELQKEKKVDPNKYDYRPEWAQFWAKRRQELYSQDIEKKKKELKLKLDLPEDAEEKVDKLKEKYKVQSINQNPQKPEPPSRQRESKIIDISDEDSPRRPIRNRRSSRSNSRSRSTRRSRSRSPRGRISRGRTSPRARSPRGRSPRGRSPRARSPRARSPRNRSPPPRFEHKRPRMRTKSRSVSPFSDDYEFESRHQYERGLMQRRPGRVHILPPPPPSSRRYGIPGSPGEAEYFDIAYKRSAPYGGGGSSHFRNGKEPPFLQHLQYDEDSRSPPPPTKSMKSQKHIELEPEPEEDTGPLTVVAVLRLLTALEDNLGSLGPKMVDLLGKALALENVQANSSDELLMNDDNCVFFETAKEKLKGLLIAEVIEDPQKVRAVKRAIKNIAAIVHQAQTKGKFAIKKDDIDSTKQKLKTANIKDLPFDRQLVASKLAAALVMQGREDLSTEEVDKLIYFFILMVKLSKGRIEMGEKPLHIADVAKDLGLPIKILPTIATTSTLSASSSSMLTKSTSSGVPLLPLTEDIFEVVDNVRNEISNDAPDKNIKNNDGGGSSLESLTDSDLQTLLQNFKHLSTEEQHHLIAHLKKLETADPVRVEKLRKFVNLADLAEAVAAGGAPATSNSNASSSQRANNDASASSSASYRGGSSMNKHYDEDSPRRSVSRDHARYSDDDEDNSNSRQQQQQQRAGGTGAGGNTVNPNKFSLDDEDDDDYNFEDVFKAASSNIIDSNSRQSKHSDSADLEGNSKSLSEPPAPGTSKSTSDPLTFNRAAMNVNLNDTQNLIANIMGNLNQNNAGQQLQQQHQTPNEAQSMPTQQQQVQSLHQHQQPPPVGNVPFYQQQQQFQQQYPPPQQQQQQYPPQHQQPYGGGGYMGNQQQQQHQQQQQYYNNMGNMGGPYNNPYPGHQYPHQQGQPPWGGGPPPQPPQPPMGYNMYGGN